MSNYFNATPATYPNFCAAVHAVEPSWSPPSYAISHHPGSYAGMVFSPGRLHTMRVSQGGVCHRVTVAQVEAALGALAAAGTLSSFCTGGQPTYLTLTAGNPALVAAHNLLTAFFEQWS